MKVAIVTGGTRGIGKEIALRLSKDGYNVVINYNSNELFAKEVSIECSKYNESLIVKADVSNYNEAEKLVQETISKFGQVDLLVNNAGITKDNLILRMTEDEFDKVVSVNLKGTFNMCKHISKYMLKQRFGKIINMASVIGIVGNLGQANYAASKGGVIALTKSLAKEFSSRSITVNAIAPGYIETDMTDSLSTDIKNQVLQAIPLKKFGKASDVANLVLFLASDNASYITGQVINIDGGMVI